MMDYQPDDAKFELIGNIIARAQERLDGRADEAAAFIEAFFSNVPPEDMLDCTEDSLFGQSVSFLAFARRRQRGEPRLRIINPTAEEHGWQNDHTVVEVVTDDMPFLVDSVSAALNHLNLPVHLIVHPVLQVTRDADGRLVDLCKVPDDGDAGISTSDSSDAAADGHTIGLESFMQFQVREQTDETVLEAACATIEKVLSDVRAAVDDWKPMQNTCLGIIKDFEQVPASADTHDIAQAREFLSWLNDDHFTFLGYRTYTFLAQFLPEEAVPEAGLGTLRDPSTRAFGELRNLSSLPEEVGAFVGQKNALIITKSTERSRVHRPVAMDAIGIKMFSECGTEVVGLRLFIGLFTADVYTNSPAFVPVLKAKLDRVMRMSGLRPRGHDGKKLMNILENLPRDELFQTDDAHLLQTAMGILNLQDRRRTALFVRGDEFQRFMSCLVFTPRDRFDTTIRIEFQKILERCFGGTMEAFHTHLTEAPLARVSYIIRTKPGALPDYAVRELARRLSNAARDWTDSLRDALIIHCGEEMGARLHGYYERAFPAGFRERFAPEAAVHDVMRAEKSLDDPSGFAMNLYRSVEDDETLVRFKVYQPQKALPLSDVLPLLENCGFRVMGEVPYKVKRRQDGDVTPVWVHDFSMETTNHQPVDLAAVRTGFLDCFTQTWSGWLEDDGFNRLVVGAGLSARKVVVLRAYAKYLQQIQVTFSQRSIENALAANAGITRDLIALFVARLAPDDQQPEAGDTVAEITERIHVALAAVESADEDRILRRYLNLIECTMRTNFWQQDPELPYQHKSYVALKLDSGNVIDLPKPHPWREVFIYSPRVEAIHLRGGPVARGGIRWSDRRDDFRTEILGLVKAQMVKNAVIVPVGSKGGFVVKRPPEDQSRQAQVDEAIECYKILMRGLLDVTDTLDGDAIVPPDNVKRLDQDDPYLVVAADKGTATFSDIANSVSETFGFWLRDAFASGGSNGYDHKAMGITARGAWEAVKRHFREMGHNTQTEPFTVIGVGDMSGDVFGNGMLLSTQIRLVAAFNHMHIFLDPDPDPAMSYEERQRLFELPRSAWSDYDQDTLSPGGMILKRSAKSVTLTPECQALLGLGAEDYSPNAVIRAILKSQVDLLWFGGIGTYIRHSSETDAQADDRANDGIRITAKQVGAKVIGEGANLGVTQRGRVEYASEGGRINTDAIDNSAGVDCSDHEVNIKILLNGIVAAGDMTEKQRNALLEDMTDEVAALVLRDNYLQTQAISVTEHQGFALLDHQQRLMRTLERMGRLERAIEYLPDDEALQERSNRGQGIVRPEIAVLIPYAKMWLYDEILASDIPDEPSLEGELIRYFPKILGERFPDAIKRHRLRREIIATVVTNSMINRVGGSFLTQLMERTGMPIPDIARAYLCVRDAFRLRDLWAAVESLDGTVPASLQCEMMTAINELVSHSVIWLLRNELQPLTLEAIIEPLREAADCLRDQLQSLLPADMAEAIQTRREALVAAGIPEQTAYRIAAKASLSAAPDIARLARSQSLQIPEAAELYFKVGHDFGMEWLRAKASGMVRGSHWNKLAVQAIIEDLFRLQREISVVALECLAEQRGEYGNGVDSETAPTPSQAVLCWRGANAAAVDRCEQVVAELKGMGDIDLAMLTVAVRQFRTLLPA